MRHIATAAIVLVDSPQAVFALQVARGAGTLVVDVLAITALQRDLPREVLGRVLLHLHDDAGLVRVLEDRAARPQRGPRDPVDSRGIRHGVLRAPASDGPGLREALANPAERPVTRKSTWAIQLELMP